MPAKAGIQAIFIDTTASVGALPSLLCQCLEQLFVNAAKTTITHHQNMVSRSGRLCDLQNQLVQIVEGARPFA